MYSEVNLAGVYIAPFMLYVITTIPIFLAIRVVLGRSGFLGWVWHPALFETALALTVICSLVLWF